MIRSGVDAAHSPMLSRVRVCASIVVVSTIAVTTVGVVERVLPGLDAALNNTTAWVDNRNMHRECCKNRVSSCWRGSAPLCDGIDWEPYHAPDAVNVAIAGWIIMLIALPAWEAIVGFTIELHWPFYRSENRRAVVGILAVPLLFALLTAMLIWLTETVIILHAHGGSNVWKATIWIAFGYVVSLVLAALGAVAEIFCTPRVRRHWNPLLDRNLSKKNPYELWISDDDDDAAMPQA